VGFFRWVSFGFFWGFFGWVFWVFFGWIFLGGFFWVGFLLATLDEGGGPASHHARHTGAARPSHPVHTQHPRHRGRCSGGEKGGQCY
jgi:hypothetical protein